MRYAARCAAATSYEAGRRRTRARGQHMRQSAQYTSATAFVKPRRAARESAICRARYAFDAYAAAKWRTKARRRRDVTKPHQLLDARAPRLPHGVTCRAASYAAARARER